MDPYVQIAQSAIVSYVQTGRADISEHLRNSIPDRRAGVFVSIHSANGELRGCIGTILPSRETMVEEIAQNAQWACSRDRRFRPVIADELDDLNIKVDVLSEPEPIDSSDQLDPDKYGLIVSTCDGRRGLLLPSLDGVDTIETQIDICRKKGNIRPNEPVSLQRFTVDRHYSSSTTIS
ncbi:MAG: AmmeMemoRadiSam system protein A [Holophagales bacterium]|jgi:AmmeMemoRadiSam system protein A|nr:AmmeMemoRadiSam system protein A [Holophagales bacterium]